MDVLYRFSLKDATIIHLFHVGLMNLIGFRILKFSTYLFNDLSVCLQLRMSFSVKYLSSLALAFLNQACQETLEDIRNSKCAIQLHLKSADDLRMWVSQH